MPAISGKKESQPEYAIRINTEVARQCANARGLSNIAQTRPTVMASDSRPKLIAVKCAPGESRYPTPLPYPGCPHPLLVLPNPAAIRRNESHPKPFAAIALHPNPMSHCPSLHARTLSTRVRKQPPTIVVPRSSQSIPHITTIQTQQHHNPLRQASFQTHVLQVSSLLPVVNRCGAAAAEERPRKH